MRYVTNAKETNPSNFLADQVVSIGQSPINPSPESTIIGCSCKLIKVGRKMQERCEETVSIPEGKLIAEVAAMELVENREVDVKQGEEGEETQSYSKERMHHHHLRHRHHGRHPHPHPHHHGHHPHHHHKEKKWEMLEKKRMNMCGGKKKGSEGWNSKFDGKLKHKLEKIDWKIESLQEKKLFILRRIQEIEKEEKKKKKNETPLPTDAA